MRRSPLLLSALLALTIPACSGEADVDVDASPSATATDTVTAEPTEPQATSSPDGDVAELAFTDCDADRFTIGYPAAWNTNEPDDLTDACRVFHPGGIETPDQPQDRPLHWAVSVYIDAVEYERATEGDGPNEEISSEELTVDGRRAHVREYRSTGDALVPEGERAYRYVVDLDGEILVAVTYSVGETDYERDKAAIDRMVTEELSISG